MAGVIGVDGKNDFGFQIFVSSLDKNCRAGVTHTINCKMIDPCVAAMRLEVDNCQWPGATSNCRDPILSVTYVSYGVPFKSHS